MSTDLRTGRSSGALTTTQRAAVVVLVVLATAVAIGIGSTSDADTDADDRWPPAGQTSSCAVVEIFTGRPGSPYNQFARVLQRRLEAAPERWNVEVVETNGSADNIYALDRDDRRCGLAIAQLGTTVDAGSGVNQFDPRRGGQPVEDLRTIGPVHHDLLHVIVRAPGSSPGAAGSEVTSVADLCDRTIAPGPPDSGTRQISTVLLRVGLPADCTPRLDDANIDEGLRRLAAGIVDAVFWAGGAGTRQIRTAIADGAKLRLLDLERFRDPIAADWDRFYRAAGRYFPGAVFPAGDLGPQDYPGIPRIGTVSLPNGLLAHAEADPALVRRATAELFVSRADYEEALWADNPGGRTIPDALSIYETPLFCYVPLHPAAAEYYQRTFHRTPRCGAA